MTLCIGIYVNYIKIERHAWPYLPCINCLLIKKSARFNGAKLLESENPVSYTEHTQLIIYYICQMYLACNFRILSIFLTIRVLLFRIIKS